MAAAVSNYFQFVTSGDTTVWSPIGGSVGTWLIVIHANDGGALADMGGDPGSSRGGWPVGAWQLLAEADTGPGLPKIRVWATKFADTVTRDIVLANGAGVDSHSHLYFVSGTRLDADASDVFFAGTATSADAVSSQPVPLYSPDTSGLLIGAWLSGAVCNYTALGGLTARTEVDGASSTSRTGEQTLSADGTSTRTATASVAGPWVAATIAVRPDLGGTVTFPNQPLRMKTELALGANPNRDPAFWAGLWTDVTDDAQPRGGGVTIGFGRPDEASSLNPSSMALTFDNTSGKYVRLNPNSPFYGQLSKNTPIQHWVDPGDGWRLRYRGFVSEFPPRSQGGQVDENMPIQAAGPTRRLSRGTVLRSPLRRQILNRGGAIQGYWPLESDFGSAIGGASMRTGGALSFEDGPPGSAGAVSSQKAGLASAPIVGMPDLQGWRVSWWLTLPDDFDTASDFSMMVTWSTPGSRLSNWVCYMNSSSPGHIIIGAFTVGEQSAVDGAVDLTSAAGGGPYLITATGEPNFSDVSYGVIVNDMTGETVDSVGTFITGDVVSPITQVGLNTQLDMSSDNPKGTVSHLFAAADPDPGSFSTFGAATWLASAGAGYAGERAVDRIRRVSTEEGVPIVIVGDAGTSEPMGPQPTARYLDILKDCGTADGGMLYERRDARLAYQARAARYNAPPALILDYAAQQVAPPFEPTDDDQHIVNRFVASRDGGGSAEVLDQDHINANGEYADSDTVNVADDDQLSDQAGWRVHVGTADDLRYPAVTPNLNGVPATIPAWVNTEQGAAITITNPGRDLPPGQITAFVEGYSETIDTVSWVATPNCSPGKPWTVIELDDAVLGRVDTDGSSLAASVTSTAATLSVASASGSPLWTYDETDVPMDIGVGGEVMTVTEIGATMNSNPYFTANTTGWTGLNATLTRSTAQDPPTGPAGVALITPDGVSATGGLNATATGVGTITPGQSYIASLWVYSPGGWSDIRPGIDWQNSSGTLLSNAFPATALVVPAATWVRLTTTLVAPASSSKAVMRGRHGGTPAAGNIWYAWGVRLTPAGSPQQMTVTRSVNGVVKAHSSGEDVRLATPPILAW